MVKTHFVSFPHPSGREWLRFKSITNSSHSHFRLGQPECPPRSGGKLHLQHRIDRQWTQCSSVYDGALRTCGVNAGSAKYQRKNVVGSTDRDTRAVCPLGGVDVLIEFVNS